MIALASHQCGLGSNLIISVVCGLSLLVLYSERGFFQGKSFIDQVFSVKMAGHWPRSFSACLRSSTSSWSINTQKKELRKALARALALVREMGPHNLNGIHLRYKGRTFKHVKTILFFLFSAKSIGKIIRTGLKIPTKRPLKKNNAHNDALSHGITTNIALVKKIYVRKQYCN